MVNGITMSKRRFIGLILGPLLFVIFLLLPVPPGMSPEGMKVAAVAALMATFWMTEAIAIPATALMPIALFPLLGVMPTSKVTAAYANHLIYLFLGGFLIAVTMEKWHLHKRIALHTIHIVGVTPQRIVLGFMLATAFLSAWISNTATAMLMVTIGLAVLHQAYGTAADADHGNDFPQSPFGTTLMLAIAYSASIGGVATLIGTPPNAILAGIIEKNYGYTIGFAQWMMFGLPLSIVMLLFTWYYLTRFVMGREVAELPGGKQAIRDQLNTLGRMSVQEKKVLAVFVFVAAAWIFRGLFDFELLKNATDSSIAIFAALLLFIIPSDWKKGEFLLDWNTAARIPWDIIILFGGGFALASGFESSGLTQWIAGEMEILKGVGLIVTVFAVVLIVIFLTEVTSNTATASLLVPVIGAFALAVQIHPYYLMVAVAIAASFAFMLPVATPPNAIVFSSRQISIPQMAKAGLWLNLIGSIIITTFIVVVLPFVIKAINSATH
jgi:sodium-dependent dicarboxylate transporter 2/3/5